MKTKKGKKKINHSNSKKTKKGKTKNVKSNPRKLRAGLSEKKLLALPLRERMLAKLKSSKFRYMNEELYTMKGKDALTYFKKNSSAFNDYHTGYQQQIEKWPVNPLDVIIKTLKKDCSSDSVIADFGCGTAKLAESLPQFTVHSFDLVALSPRVTVCDIANTPLSPGSVNIVVCCLSLMGTNLADYVREANRILKIGGILKIAEVESRFENLDEFLQRLTTFGFTVVKTNLEHDIFYFMDLRKSREIGKKAKKKLPELTLQPCLYKKR